MSAGVVSLEPGQGMTLPHVMPTHAWRALRKDLRDPDTAVSMKLGYAFCRHLTAIVVDACLMLEFKQYVVVQLRVSQFDDGL